jgi:hypothetical protein
MLYLHTWNLCSCTRSIFAAPSKNNATTPSYKEWYLYLLRVVAKFRHHIYSLSTDNYLYFPVSWQNQVAKFRHT